MEKRDEEAWARIVEEQRRAHGALGPMIEKAAEAIERFPEDELEAGDE